MYGKMIVDYFDLVLPKNDVRIFLYKITLSQRGHPSCAAS